jgi:hypothetical protein
VKDVARAKLPGTRFTAIYVIGDPHFTQSGDDVKDLIVATAAVPCWAASQAEALAKYDPAYCVACADGIRSVSTADIEGKNRYGVLAATSSVAAVVFTPDMWSVSLYAEAARLARQRSGQLVRLWVTGVPHLPSLAGGGG